MNTSFLNKVYNNYIIASDDNFGYKNTMDYTMVALD